MFNFMMTDKIWVIVHKGACILIKMIFKKSF